MTVVTQSVMLSNTAAVLTGQRAVVEFDRLAMSLPRAPDPVRAGRDRSAGGGRLRELEQLHRDAPARREDLVDEAVLLRLGCGHEVVAVEVLLDLLQRL